MAEGTVGTLTVNLGLNSAGFSGGIQDVSKQAKKVGQDIKESMEGANYSMMEARHGAMMLGETFGVHIPRGISTMIASFGPVGSVLAAAFPFVAIGLGATLLIKHLEEMHKAAEKAEDAQRNAGIVGVDTLDKLKDKLAEARMKFDELSGKGADALKIKLQLLSSGALKELTESFNSLTKAMDTAFTDMGSKGTIAKLLGLDNASQDLVHIRRQVQDIQAGDGTAAEKAKAIGDSIRKARDQAQQDYDAMKKLPVVSKTEYAFDEHLVKGGKGIGITQEQLDSQRDLYTQLDDLVTASGLIQKTTAQEVTNAVLGFNKKQTEDQARLSEEEDKFKEKLMKDAVEIGSFLRKEQGPGFKNPFDEKATHEAIEYWHGIAEAAKAASQAEVEAAKSTSAAQNEVDSAVREQMMARIKEQAAQFKISKKEELQDEIDAAHAERDEKIKTISDTAKAEQAAIQKEIAVNKQMAANSAAVSPLGKEDPAYKAYMNENVELLAKFDSIGTKAQADVQAATIKTDTAVQKLNADLVKSGQDWKSVFSQAGPQMQTLAQGMKGEVNTAITQFSDSIGKAVIEGKSFSKAIKDMCKEILESVVSMVARVIIEWAILQAIPGAAALLGMTQGASAGIGGLGKMFGFHDGGIVPSAEGGMVTPGNWDQGHLAMLHSQEMVLPADVTQKVLSGSGDGGKVIHQHHVTYSPTIHAVDGKGVGDMLNKHGELFTAHLMKNMRRLNK